MKNNNGYKNYCHSESFQVYGTMDYFDYIRKQLEKNIKKNYKKEFNILTTDNSIKILNRGILYLIVSFCIKKPDKNLQYFQTGQNKLEVFVLKPTQEKLTENDLKLYKCIEELTLNFSPTEEMKIKEYTPVLGNLIGTNSTNLSNHIIIFREHSLLSVYNMFSVFEDHGLKPQNGVYYGKGDLCKNLERVEQSLRNKGYSVYTLSPFESISETGKTEDEMILPDSAKRLKSELEPFFKKAEENNLRIIVMDDGGLLVTSIIDLFGDKLHLIDGLIETTKGGMNALKARRVLPKNIINLADSGIKNAMSPVIAHSIIHRLREIIPHIRFLGETAIVVGYGALGKEIAADLKNLGLVVHICELDEEKCFEAQTDGYPVSTDARKMFSTLNPKLVLGCTGLDALTFENLTKLPNETYIATVSSNEIKQSFLLLDKYCKKENIPNYGRTYKFPDGRKITILADGASLNLFNGEGAIHADYQPFLASMCNAVLTLAKNSEEDLPSGLDTQRANRMEKEAKILSNFVNNI